MEPTEILRHHYRTCNLCEAMCGIEIVAQGDKVLSIRGDKDDPLSRGYLCPKAVALQDVHADPDRLRHPMRRTASEWERAGWEEALDEVASRFRAIQSQHGPDAVGVYTGNPSVHNYGTIFFSPALLQTLRTRNRFSATSLDQLPHMMASAFLFGHQILMPVPDVDHTDFLVIMGGNPLVSNGSIMSAPDIRKRLQAIRERGGRVVVIDPRHTETARVADQHLFIRPGTDALLLLAVLNVLHAENLARPGRLEAFLEGVEDFWGSIQGITPEQAAVHTGVDAGALRALAHAFAAANRAVWYGRVGVSQHEFGTLTQWLICALNIVTGNLDRPGGAMFTRPALEPMGMGLIDRGNFERWRSRVRGLPEFGDELPAAVMAEEMLTPGPGQIRALLTIAGNPVLSSPNGRRLEQALAGLEFMASIDFYRNETTRHAHVILPPTDALEHDNYDAAFNLLSIRNTARYSPALFPPAEDTRHEWQILLELNTRLHSRGSIGWITGHLLRAVLRRLGPAGLLDFGLRIGPYGSGWRFWKRGLRLRALREAPHGIDFGPLEPCLPGRLQTATKRIQLAPKPLLADLERLRARFSLIGGASGAAVARDLSTRAGSGSTQDFHPRLALIGRRHLRSNNSWMHNSERLVRGHPRCTLLMHPEDAERHGVEDGGQVRVTSRVGSLEATVEVSAEIMPGVVSLPHGWGHTRAGVQLRTAQKYAGVSVNDITDDRAIDGLSGTAAFNGVPVMVEPLAASSVSP